MVHKDTYEEDRKNYWVPDTTHNLRMNFDLSELISADTVVKVRSTIPPLPCLDKSRFVRDVLPLD